MCRLDQKKQLILLYKKGFLSTRMVSSEKLRVGVSHDSRTLDPSVAARKFPALQPHVTKEWDAGDLNDPTWSYLDNAIVIL